MRHPLVMPRLGVSQPGKRAMLALLVAATISAGGLLDPPPVHASWGGSLTISFFANGTYGDGRGRVTTDDGGIDCYWNPGPPYGDCFEAFEWPDFLDAVDVGVTFTPEPGSYVCTGFTDNCKPEGGSISFALHYVRSAPGSPTLNPSFNLRSFQVHVTATGPGNVTGNGASCPTGPNDDYCWMYKYGASASLQAIPDAGYPFNTWSNQPCSPLTSPTCSFTVSKDVWVYAHFGKVDLWINRSEGGKLCLPDYPTLCTGPNVSRIGTTLLKGTSVRAVATPDAGWTFASWSSGPCSGQPATCSFVLSVETSLTATFRRLSTPPPPTPKPTSKPTARPTSAPTAAPTPKTSPAMTALPVTTATLIPTTSMAPLDSGVPESSSEPGASAAPSSVAGASGGPERTPGAVPAPAGTDGDRSTGAPNAAVVNPGAASSGSDLSWIILAVLGLLALFFAAYVAGRRIRGPRGASRIPATRPRA